MHQGNIRTLGNIRIEEKGLKLLYDSNYLEYVYTHVINIGGYEVELLHAICIIIKTRRHQTWMHHAQYTYISSAIDLIIFCCCKIYVVSCKLE